MRQIDGLDEPVNIIEAALKIKILARNQRTAAPGG
jgi:hypothetical protein